MNNSSTWYQSLIKPSWAPPSWLFGPVWSVLYTIIFFSFGTVFLKVFRKELPVAILLPFVLNLIFNFSFTYFQFGLKNNLFAAIDILLVLLTLIWALIVIWKTSADLRWIAYVNIPYLLWVSFATTLQLTITYLNK